MAHSVAEDLLLVQAVEAVLLVPDVEQVRVDVVVALGEHAVLDHVLLGSGCHCAIIIISIRDI